MAMVRLTQSGLARMVTAVTDSSMSIKERNAIVCDVLDKELPREGDRIEIMADEDNPNDKTFIGEKGIVERYYNSLAGEFFGVKLDCGPRFLCSRTEIAKDLT